MWMSLGTLDVHEISKVENLQGSASSVVKGLREAFVALAQDAGLGIYITCILRSL